MPQGGATESGDMPQGGATESGDMPQGGATESGDMPHEYAPRWTNPVVRDELLGLFSDRYRSAAKSEKSRILDMFVARTGYHRKHAVRLLREGVTQPQQRFFDASVQSAVAAVWQAAGRPGSRRLKKLLPELVPALEKQGCLPRDPVLQGKLLKASAATLDRLLAPVRAQSSTDLLEKRLEESTAVIRDIASFSLPSEGLSPEERRYLEAMSAELMEELRQASRRALKRLEALTAESPTPDGCGDEFMQSPCPRSLP